MQSLTCDVAIVGAGPGGLAAAKKAAELGLDSLLLEKQYEIGYPVHTSGGSYIEDMERLGVPPRFYNPIRRVTLASSNNEVEFAYQRDEACILDLRGMTQYLAVEAAKRGCRIELGTTVTGAIKEETTAKGIITSRFGEEIRVNSKLVIDASGLSAVVARDLGLIPPTWKRFGLGVEFEAFVEHLEKDKAYLLFGNKVAPTGYAWIFPVSDDKARVGVGVTKPDSDMSPYVLLDDMLSDRPKQLVSLGRITPIEVHAGSVPIETIPGKSVANGLMVIGDAACQANPIVGEGIRIAMTSGVRAAETASEAVERDDLTESGLASYEREAKKLAKLNSVALRIQRRAASYSEEADWDDAVEKLKSFSPDEFKMFLKADFSRRNLVETILRHPKLAASTTLSLMRDQF